MNKKIIAFLMAMLYVSAFAACGNTSEQTNEVSESTSAATMSEASETVSESETETSETILETEIAQSIALSPEIKIDENDETVIKGREFGEKYADMYYNYGCGAAWENYIETKYFDFDDKSEDNYFEKDGRPFYKLLITDYTYDELMEYIKSFFDDEAFTVFTESLDGFIAEKNNQIYVNGNEPTFIYGMRNERAQIIGYTENDDGSVTYECYAKTTEKTDNDLYFSFTLNSDGKLCNVHDYSELPDIELFSTSMY